MLLTIDTLITDTNNNKDFDRWYIQKRDFWVSIPTITILLIPTVTILLTFDNKNDFNNWYVQ